MVNKVGDISIEELISEYGMTEEQANKLMQELPKLCKEAAAAGSTPGAAQLPTPGEMPGYPYPVAPTDAGGYPYPYPYPMQQGYTLPPINLEELIAYIVSLVQGQGPGQRGQAYPLADEKALDSLEKMTDAQLEECLNFVDRYLVSKDKYPMPETAGMRQGGAVGLRWPRDDMVKRLAYLILFGNTSPGVGINPPEPSPPVTMRNQKFWGRVFQKRDSLDSKIAADSALAESLLPPPFFYEDEIKLDVDKKGIVVEDGILKAPVSAAAAMVQEYTIDGKKVRVLKDPKELQAAADHARMLPITNDHPPQRIVTDQKEIKGWTDRIVYDEKAEKLRTTIEVTDKDTIEDIQNGKTDVSIGFMCDLDYCKGKFGEDEYDAVQRNLVLNHLAIVDQGRCPTGKCGIAQDAKEKTVAKDGGKLLTEQDLIDDAVTKGCPGGEGCKCGLHKGLDAAKVADACKAKTKKEEIPKPEVKSDSEPKPEPKAEEKKTGDAKMKYMLKEKDGHTHTAELDETGNGESSTDMEHKHMIEGMTVMEAGDPAHIHAIEEVKEEKKEEMPPEEKPMDAAAKIHEGLLAEKTAAIQGLADDIAKNGATMKPDDLKEKISTMQNISWQLTELVGVIRAKDMKVPATSVDAALIAINDNKSIEKVVNDIKARHTVLVDEVMDFNPPNPREYFEAKDSRELEEIIKLLDSQSPITIPTGDHSSRVSNDDSGSKGKRYTDALQKKANEALGIK